MTRLDPLRVVPADPAWRARFADERDAVSRALRPLLVHPVEHIGSTAVPGLAAKPIIDMLAVVSSHEAAGERLGRLTGWVHAPEPGDTERRRWSVCRPSIEHRTHHLHVVEDGAWPWRDWLVFRDTLREDAGLREEYGALKQALADEHVDDRSAYRAGKEPFIRRVLSGTGRP